MYTKPYNLKNLEDGLQELFSQLKGQQINEIAALEMIDPITVKRYLKGQITTPAIGKAILDRGRDIVRLREREKVAA